MATTDDLLTNRVVKSDGDGGPRRKQPDPGLERRASINTLCKQAFSIAGRWRWITASSPTFNNPERLSARNRGALEPRANLVEESDVALLQVNRHELVGM